MFGFCLYSDQVNAFDSVENSLATLFSLLVGDAVWDTYMDLLFYSTVPKVITISYLTSYIFLFIYGFSMFILSVVEEVFISQGRS